MANHLTQSILNKSSKDKFTLTISLPEALRKINRKSSRSDSTVDLDKLQFSIFGTVVPKKEIPAEDVRYGGGNAFISSHNKPSFDPISVKFTIDNEFNNYWVIYKWIDFMRNEKTEIFDGEIFPKDHGFGQYTTDFVITARDEYHNEIIQWTYKYAFPTTLGEIDYNYRESGEIETSFEFVFAKIETKLLQV